MNIPYRPARGVFGDPIPFFWKGRHHLFYLRGEEDDALSGIARWVGSGWHHIVSDDLVSWEELPPAFAPGPSGSQDYSCCATGRVIERAGVFHAFYPGFNLHRLPRTAVCHATSNDLVHWEKDPRNPVLSAEERWYENLFGDTFVFWNEQERRYWMLVTTQLRTGPTGYRGCIAQLTSSDLEHWEHHTPFWAPGIPLFEVANLFPLNGRWYLTYSTWLGDRMAGMYRTSTDIAGPWSATGDGQLDGPQWYGMNTGSDGTRRLAFGWVPTLEANRAGGMWQWGGDLGTPRELRPGPDGALTVRCPSEVLARYDRYHGEVASIRAETGLGAWSWAEGRAACSVPDRLGIAWLPAAPDPCQLEATVTFTPGTRRVGFLLRTKPDLSAGHSLNLEPGMSRVTIDHWPRPAHEAPALARWIHLEPGRPITCRILLSGTVVEAFIDDQVVITARVPADLSWPSALIVQDGSARFEGMAQRPRIE